MLSKRRVVRQCFGLRPQQKEMLRRWTECLRCGAASCFTTGTDRRRRCFQLPQTAVSKTGPRAEGQPSNHQPDIHHNYIQPFMHLSICPSIHHSVIHPSFIHSHPSLLHPSIHTLSIHPSKTTPSFINPPSTIYPFITPSPSIHLTLILPSIITASIHSCIYNLSVLPSLCHPSMVYPPIHPSDYPTLHPSSIQNHSIIYPSSVHHLSFITSSSIHPSIHQLSIHPSIQKCIHPFRSL